MKKYEVGQKVRIASKREMLLNIGYKLDLISESKAADILRTEINHFFPEDMYVFFGEPAVIARIITGHNYARYRLKFDDPELQDKHINSGYSFTEHMFYKENIDKEFFNKFQALFSEKATLELV